MKALVKNASDESQVKDAEEKTKDKRKQDLLDVYNILNTVHGRRFFNRIIEECNVFGTSFNTNALTMALSEGVKNVGLKLLADMNEAYPEAYFMMLKENKKEN